MRDLLESTHATRLPNPPRPSNGAYDQSTQPPTCMKAKPIFLLTVKIAPAPQANPQVRACL